MNLDEIARGLSPLDPIRERQRAARVALDMMKSLISDGQSFSLETTLSGRTHLALLDRAMQAGFRTNLLFFAVRSPDISLARISRRVSEGGHDVPDPDVRRRFARGLANLTLYAGKVDLWRVFDNNGGQPHVVAEGRRGCLSLLDEAAAGLPPSLPPLLAALPPCPEAG